MIKIKSSYRALIFLADEVEMNFLQSKNQAEIAKNDGLARLNISRMLTEVRSAGKN